MITVEPVGYRSVPMRSVNPSPSRRAILEVFLSRDKAPAAGGASAAVSKPAPPVEPRSQRPTSAGAAPTAKNGAPTPALDLSKISSNAVRAPPARRAQTPPVRAARSQSPVVRSTALATPRSDVIVNLINFESLPAVRGVFNSPRSLAVCAENGIHPEELVPKAPSQFEAPGVPREIAALRYEHFEARRKEKVAMLRAGREARVYEEHRRAAATPRAASGTPSAAAPGGHLVAVGGAPSEPAHQVPAAVRAKVAIEKNAKRQLVYERALKQKADREAEALRRQLEQERRSIALQQQQEAERQRVVEIRRLRFEDAREHVQHLRRQEEFAARQRAQRLDDKTSKPIDPFQLCAAKEQFMTPRLRAARRSSSAGR